VAKNFCYWVIVVGTEPTAFRAKDAEVLVPTLRQLQRTQPDVEMKWFERNRLWESPEKAADAVRARRRTPERRGREWRPGGAHADPRAKYDVPRDEKREQFRKRLVAKKVASTQAPGTAVKPPRTFRPARPPKPRDDK
jgi:hypothetical protein